MYNHKIKTDYNFLYLKSHVKMIIINNFILNKNNISKSNIKINMMILLIMINDHYLWILHQVILNHNNK